MMIVGLDPSFKSAGIAVYNTLTNELQLDRVGLPPNPDKSFEQIYWDCNMQSKLICRKILDMTDKEESRVYLFSEVPPPQGQFASGLYALDVMTLTKLESYVDEIYRFYPTYIGSLHGKRKWNKSESVALAKQLIQSHNIDYTKRFNADEAEAFLFMFRGLTRLGFATEADLQVCPKLAVEKEKLIYKS